MFSGWTIWGSNVPRLFSCFYPVAGITLWPFVFIAEEHPTPEEQEEHDGLIGRLLARMSNHERIHIAQASEMLVVPFYALWLGDFALGLCRHRGNAKEAYRNIRLEQEAFDHEHDPDYLANRPWFAWRAYPRREVAERWKRSEEELRAFFERAQEQELAVESGSRRE